MNKDNYKKAIDQIHAKEELKSKTFEKIFQKEKNKYSYIKYFISCAAMIMIIFTVGIMYKKQNDKDNVNVNPNIEVSKAYNDLPRFENIEQLKEVLEKNYKLSREENKGIMEDSSLLDFSTSTADSVSTSEKEDTDYMTTNVQVENVDEADIVKTDGEYIYYVSNNRVYIVNAENLEIVSTIKVEDVNERFYPREIYINKDKLIILGRGYEYKQTIVSDIIKGVFEDRANVNTDYMAKAIVYDISNKNEPKQTRKVSIDGSYIESRMIGDNIYFISTKLPKYYKDISDDRILPMIKDTSMSEETQKIEPTDIIYFEDTENYNYMIVAGFNINNNNPVNTETFFGASSTIYASQDNLYITQRTYKNGYYSSETENIIYKFNLKDAKIQLQCKGKVDGYLNDQFSMDEYEGNLRIATTSGYNKKSTNQLYILDENLKQIGKLADLAKGEKIYSVRFIGKVGYIVTFEKVDPLFVIDLSNPTKPIVKGQLKIPGYSSYLHPYDETHIIGIGYNTKSNGYGGVKNDTMKMSMFDVSDLENPKEMFNIEIGNSYTYSEITSNHKALFYNKDRALIGFPLTTKFKNESKYKNGLVLYKINLEKGFEEYGKILEEANYKTNINRAIYIGNKLYTLSNTQIIKYDLNTIQKIKEVEID